ncbi:hypothetical protein GQX73_g104 [Xylaria multiplex]|uniref:L-ornithine N(5)-monooxygenase [NAD(P)H] n=1 Tax=Xylaria multiplex TaxID=323545 RepID=A0A7C8NEC0_9PEZI|nr:hypothetical protein GQX73_g104 [Xylaria multiplex]
MAPVPSIHQVIPGALVNIVLKADQPTGRQVQGIVQHVLTKGNHPRGIKVRLTDSRVGRVQSMALGVESGSSTHSPSSSASTKDLSPSSLVVTALASVGGPGGQGHRPRYRDARLEEPLDVAPEQIDLGAPMFFHVDPLERDGLLSYAYANGRSDELRELHGCVGKEFSKFQRKKREKMGRQQQNIPTVDERDRQDYYVPSTPLFFSHCDCLVDRYELRDTMLSQEQVEDIRYDYVKEFSDDQKIFRIKTNKGCHYSKIAVLAIGGNPPKIPYPLTSREMEGATHAMDIKAFPPLYMQKKIANKARTNVLVVGGGLTSAQIADLAVRRGVTKVWLIMRGPLKIKHFDIGLEWVGKFRNVEHIQFWNSETAEERCKKLMDARNGGSITPYYKEIVEKHISTGRVDMLLHTTIDCKKWDPSTKTWSVSLKGEQQDLPPIDHIYFATGVGTDFESLPCLQSMCRDYPVDNCGGFPCITPKMAWRDDVPLFVAGRFAALQLGPGAHNLIGTKEGGDRANWTEDKFNYLTGRGSRFDALADIPVAG